MIGRRGFFKLLGAGAVGAMIPLLVPVEPVNLTVPMTWTGATPDKVAMVKALLQNAIEAHDRMIEEALFRAGAIEPVGDSHDIRGLTTWYNDQYDWTSSGATPKS